MIEARRSSSSVAAAVAASAYRARLIAGLQAIALIAIVVGRCLGGGPAGGRADAGVDAPAPAPRDADVPAVDAPEPPCAEQLACRAACEGGEGRRRAESCVRLADMLRTGTGGATRDRIAARTRYRDACLELKDALACTHLALAAGLSHDLDLAPDWAAPEQAPLGMLAAACDTGRERGELACAALELRKAPPALGRAGRDGLCPDAAADRTGCAARLALAACQGEPADAEACHLAAAAGLPTAADAGARLAALCSAGDRPACLYRYALSPRGQRDRASLFTACSELESEKAASIAGACVARALDDTRQVKFADLACELGACQDRGLPRPALAVLKRSCDAGHANGCANLVFARRNDPAARKALLEHVARRLPQYADRVAGDPPADWLACALGSLDGCGAAIARLAAPGASADDKQLAERLMAYRARLAAPLAAP